MRALIGTPSYVVRSEDFLTGPNYLPRNTWAFYGAVFGPERWRLYLNGEKIGDKAVDVAFPVTEVGSASFILGGGGVVDEAFSTATALTDQQWADLYAAATAN